MPFINTKVNVAISKEQEISMKEKLGKAIETLPGKTEDWLMLCFEEQSHLYFKGEGTKPLAFVEVKIYGHAEGKAYNQMTEQICRILDEVLCIPPAQVYVKYEECEHWGWNENNF